MTEVWKSQGRKYCEFCDCWFADNKISTSFHENGKRHKESVEKKVKEIQKKGSEKEKKEKDEKRFLEMMEKGAAAAIEKDIKQDPRMINHYFGDDIEVPLPERSDDPPLQGPALPPTKKQKLDSHSSSSSSSKVKPNKAWREAVSPEGYTYYWNVETNQSVWVAPPGGYVPLSEQTVESAETLSEQQQQQLTQSSDTKQNQSSAGAESRTSASVGVESRSGAGLVQRKSWKERAYGNWNSATKPEADRIDYQLPASTVQTNLERERVVAAETAATKGEQESQFKTKVVPSLTSSASSSAPRTTGIVFKKRKSNPAGDRRLQGDS